MVQEVQDFVARARRHSGADLVTHMAFTHYNAIHAFKLAMEKAGSTSGDRVMAALDGMELRAATGLIKFSSGYASLPMYVARAVRGRLEVVQKFDAAPPGVTCA